MRIACVIVAPLVLWAGLASAQNISVTVTVQGRTGPWNAGIFDYRNSAYEYDFFENDFTTPVGISVADGFRFSAGDSLTIKYVSGLVSVGPGSGWPYVDANGDTNTNVSGYDRSGTIFPPSVYMNPELGPYYLSELVGTFADSSGEIVGTPFAIGNLGTFTVPAGATQLQLGVNDTLYQDNSGSWNIQVSGPGSVPFEITCPSNITVSEDSGECSAVVVYPAPTVSPTDATVVCDPPSGSNFPMGTNTVNCVATDPDQNTTNCSFTVTVVDDKPPVITDIAVIPRILWPPDHKMVLVTVNYTTTDNCGFDGCELSATSNERGTMAKDIQLIPGDSHHLYLRADRSGQKNGRIYTIRITCTDTSGNSTTESARVIVPHDLGRGRGIYGDEHRWDRRAEEVLDVRHND